MAACPLIVAGCPASFAPSYFGPFNSCIQHAHNQCFIVDAGLIHRCNKHETGYDDPKLCGMFVDRKLQGTEEGRPVMRECTRKDVSTHTHTQARVCQQQIHAGVLYLPQANGTGNLAGGAEASVP